MTSHMVEFMLRFVACPAQWTVLHSLRPLGQGLHRPVCRNVQMTGGLQILVFDVASLLLGGCNTTAVTCRVEGS